jgi:methyltransferase (TIGR00027 family)
MLTVSDTAYAIAHVRALESALPPAERLFDDPYAALFAAAGEHAREGTERFQSLPFFRDGIRLRTRFFDDFVRDGVTAGARQVVLLGAGFDARGLRFPELAAAGARVYEVDFEALLAAKRALLAGAGVATPPHVAYVACDFTAERFEDGLHASLRGAGFRAGEGALFVWEGVIAYLDRASIERSLRFMAAAGGAGTRVAFDHGDAPFAPETTLDFVRRFGFSGCEEVAYDTLWRRYLPGDAHENAWYCRATVATTGVSARV